MPKPIIISFQGKDSSFEHSKLERSKLYGSRRRVALDSEGNSCIKASLTEEGSMIIRSGMTAQGYFTVDGKWIPNKELVGLDEEDKPIKLIDSTLGNSQKIEGPANPSELLDLAVITTYQLNPVNFNEQLKKEIDAGQIFRFPFNYRSDYRAETAFLLGNKEGYFCVVGVPTHPEWCELKKVAVETFEEDEDSDDLDFDMF
jgi:hypothetical protein